MRIILGGKGWLRKLIPRRPKTGGKRLYGDTWYQGREIRIVRGQNEREALDTEIHEAMHAMFPWMREWLIDRSAGELTALLYDHLGYRVLTPDP